MLSGLKGLSAFVIAVSATLALAGVALAQTPTAAPIAACPTGVTLTVSPPTASAPSTVTVALSSQLNIKPASAGDPTSFHLHYFVDTEATATGTAVPTGNPKIIHSGSTTQDLGALTAGSHTVTVVLGQFNHVACDTRGSVTFTVTAALAPTGSGGYLDRDGGFPTTIWLALAAASLAVLGLGAGFRKLDKRG